jgi:hypothetical protein
MTLVFGIGHSNRACFVHTSATFSAGSEAWLIAFALSIHWTCIRSNDGPDTERHGAHLR